MENVWMSKRERHQISISFSLSLPVFHLLNPRSPEDVDKGTNETSSGGLEAGTWD
jgi:hypothetical protein